MNSRRLIGNPQVSKMALIRIEFQDAPALWSLTEFTIGALQNDIAGGDAWDGHWLR
jgi:hypothetical protein